MDGKLRRPLERHVAWLHVRQRSVGRARRQSVPIQGVRCDAAGDDCAVRVLLQHGDSSVLKLQR